MYVISINFCSNWHCSYFNFSVYMPKMSYTEIWNWETLFSTWDPERLLWPIFAWVNIWWMKMIFWRTKEGHQPIFLLMYWVGSLMLENRQVKNMNYQFHEFFYCFSLLFFKFTKKNPIFSDMWALGVVLFTMLYGQFPFYDSAPHELFQSKFLWAQ